MAEARHPLARLAFIAWALTLAAALAALSVRAASGVPPLPNRFSFTDAALLAFDVLGFTYATVGALIARRLPTNHVGWILIAIGACYGAAVLGGALAAAAAQAGATVVVEWAAVAGHAGSIFATVGLLVLPLAFPTLPPTRLPLYAVGIGWLAFATATVLQPGQNFLFPTVRNPLGVGPIDFTAAAGGAWSPAGFVIAGVILAVVSATVTRYRASRGIERLQLKWFVSAVGVSMIVQALAVLASAPTVDQSGIRHLALASYGLASTLVPIAIGFAILRYRLYAIDHLVNRALVYAVVTTVLAVAYALSVVVIPAAVPGLAGADSVVVAVATLVAFGAFRPLRNRVQLRVDRRFNRSRYDAQQAVDRFAARLRDEVDLHAIEVELGDSVQLTVAPASLRVWLRDSAP